MQVCVFSHRFVVYKALSYSSLSFIKKPLRGRSYNSCFMTGENVESPWEWRVGPQGQIMFNNQLPGKQTDPGQQCEWSPCCQCSARVNFKLVTVSHKAHNIPGNLTLGSCELVAANSRGHPWSLSL